MSITTRPWERGRDFSITLLKNSVNVQEGEIRALLLSFVYFFFLLAGYYIIRPIRDEMGVAGGVDNLPWLVTGTLAGMMLANPIFSFFVARYSRVKFITWANRFFVANLVGFFMLLTLTSHSQQIWVGRIFYIWTSVFNLFVVSIFWGLMADTFNADQGKRLFGFISAGGTLGSIIGSAITTFLVAKLGQHALLLISAIMLELTVQSLKAMPQIAEPTAKQREEIIHGSAWDGIKHALSSPYLLAICGYMLLYAITSTVVYFQQSDIAGKAILDRNTRTAFFAQIDLIVNVVTLVLQIFLTGRLMRVFGITVTLLFLPILNIIGFAVIGFYPLLSLLVIFQVSRRVANFAFARPAREILFTVISREDKYKSKNFIDTFIYRGGDQAAAWSYPMMKGLGLSLAGISFLSVPISIIWLSIAYWLGRKQTQIAKEPVKDEAAQGLFVAGD